MKDINELKSIIQEMVHGFTRFHDDLHLSVVQTSSSINISLAAHADDTPKLIGSGGGMVKSLREIAQRMADSLQTKVNINVTEPTVGQRMGLDPFRADIHYKRETEVKLLERIGQFIFNDGIQVTGVDLDKESTMLTLAIDEDYDEALEAALSTVFKAIGRTKGRKLEIELDSL